MQKVQRLMNLRSHPHPSRQHQLRALANCLTLCLVMRIDGVYAEYGIMTNNALEWIKSLSKDDLFSLSISVESSCWYSFF